ncbi:hypothetical protein [Sporosarcina trichiuri]|uniref:hypothetical protein n=1 Tax=Sporosarcina trichiuri TaxID=3056445 RepID=UPI0025B51639|nr:hypothetical protein [Sporosarcina sp. 0.2-SM1T-5]WJY28895.1 hypothetical protein QWT68_07895 [Sporosarcina sp. 0.2-SM1T-5]
MMNRKLMYTALSASLLLAACGTSDETADPAETVNTDTEGTGADTNADSENKPAEGENTNSEGITEDDVDESGAADSETDTDADTDSETDSDSADTDDDSAALPDASETKSDEQNFKMQVLPDYTLTSEEPGRDVLYAKDNEEWFMSIETTDAADADYDKGLEMMNEKLAASSSDSDPVELTEDNQLPTDTSLEKVKAYRVNAPEGPITAMIFEKDQMLVTVMMYDNADEDYYSDFLKMAETIESAE